MKGALYARVSTKDQSCQIQLRDSRLFTEARSCSYSLFHSRETPLKQSSLFLKYSHQIGHGISFKSALAEKNKA